MPPILLLSIAIIVSLVVFLVAFLVAYSSNEGETPHWGILMGIAVAVSIAGWQGHAFARDLMRGRQAEAIIATMSADPIFDAVRSTNTSTWLEVKTAIDGTAGVMPADRELEAEMVVAPILGRYVTERISLMPDDLVPSYAVLLADIIDANTGKPGKSPASAPAKPAGETKGNALPSLNSTAPTSLPGSKPAKPLPCLDALGDPKAPSRLPGEQKLQAKVFFLSLFRAEPAYTRRVLSRREVAQALIMVMPKAASSIRMTGEEYVAAISPGVTDYGKCRLSAAMYRQISNMPPKRGAPLLRGLAGGSMGT